MNLLAEITLDAARITLAKIEQARSTLTPIQPGEPIIAVIEDNEAIILWTLAINYQRQSRLASHSAYFDTSDTAAKKQLIMRAARYSYLEDATRVLAWVRIRDIVGEPAVVHENIGLRENYTLVVSANSGEPEVEAFQLPVEAMALIGKILRKRMALSNESESKDKKPPVKSKPQ